MSLNDIRSEIDYIDDQILSLFLKRIKCIEKISKIKGKEKIQVLDKDREQEILLRIKRNSGEYEKITDDLFKKILEISKKIQKNKII